MATRTSRSAPPPAGAVPRAAGASPLALLVVAAAGAIVWHRAIGYFFAQDDFAGLARAQGLAPRLAGPWRWLSGQAYFDVMRLLAGHHAAAYHLASLGAHLATALLLFLFLKRRASVNAALCGAVAFVTHPATFTAVYSISGLGEILALGAALAAMLALEQSGRSRWLAPPLFGLSLLAKESTLLLPLAALSFAPPKRGARAQLLAMAIIAAATLASFVMADAFGVRRALPETAAYSLAFDATLARNVLTFLGWTLNANLITVHHFSEAPDPESIAAGAIALLVWIAGFAWRPLRRRGWLPAGLLYVAFLLPVLPLHNHVYHYYLYAPLAGAAWGLAILVDAVREHAGARRAAGAAALALAAALTLNGYAFVRKIEFTPFAIPGLRADATVDRALIAERVVGDLAGADLPPATRLAFWAPTLRPARPDSVPESYMERNVRAALFDGLGVRVMFPQVDSVAFVHDYRSLPDPWRYAVYRVDGSLRVAASAELDTVLEHFPAARGPG